MDPYNNFYDFIKLVYGSKYKEPMIDNYEQVREKMLSDSTYWQIPPVAVSTFTVNTCVPTSNVQKAFKALKENKEKGNNPMDDKIYYLQTRVNTIDYTKDQELRKQFGLVDDDAPRSAVEFVKRIQDGKFTLKDGADKNAYRPSEYIRWRDPSVKEDKDGYVVAENALRKMVQATVDIVNIKSADDGLTAVQALEAWTYTAPVA